MANAIRSQVQSTMKQRADAFGLRMLQLQPFDMSHDECLHLLAPTYHHEILKTAATVAELSPASHAYITVRVPYTLDGVENPTFDLTMRTHAGKEPPLRPRSPTWQPCDLAIQKKVTDWGEHYLRTMRMTATVRWIVERLSEICDTGHQVRYVWPAILHLCSDTSCEDTRKWAQKYAARTVPRAVPQITPAFRKILMDASEWCAQAVLLSEIKGQEHGEVTINYDKCFQFTLQLEGNVEVVLSRAVV